jgi:hypothetical protein
MLSLVYVSTASRPFDDDDLAVLLLGSRANNARSGLSGLLLHRDGKFLQVLEGPEDTVRSKFAAIEKDPRHRDVHVLAEEQVGAPRFGRWSMSYQPSTDELADELPGFDNFLTRTDVPTDGDRTSTVVVLLEWFRDQMPTRLRKPSHRLETA